MLTRIFKRNSTTVTNSYTPKRWSHNRPFYWYSGHIEFTGIRFKEYYGVPRRLWLSIYACFLGKKRTSLYISWEKGNHNYIQTQHNNLFLGKLKGHVNTERVYRITLMPPGHSIILIKYNKFNMATFSVKRSIEACSTTSSSKWGLNYLLCPGSKGNLFFSSKLKSQTPWILYIQSSWAPLTQKLHTNFQDWSQYIKLLSVIERCPY